MFADCWSFHNGRRKKNPVYANLTSGLKTASRTIYTQESLRWSDGHPIIDDFVFLPGYSRSWVPNSDRDLFRQGTDKQGRPRYPELTKLDALRFSLSSMSQMSYFRTRVAVSLLYPNMFGPRCARSASTMSTVGLVKVGRLGSVHRSRVRTGQASCHGAERALLEIRLKGKPASISRFGRISDLQ